MQIPIQQLQKRFPLIIALACGILAILLLNIYIRRREEQIWRQVEEYQQTEAKKIQPAVSLEMKMVLVAKKDIPKNTPIIADDLIIKEIPVEYIQPGAIFKWDEIIGQIAANPISAGEQIIKTKLTTPEKVVSLSEITPGGKKAITISLDNVAGLAGLLKPGDYVDILATIAIPSDAMFPKEETVTIIRGLGKKGLKQERREPEQEAPRVITTPLFQNVLVLAVDSEYTYTPIKVAKKEDKKAGPPKTVTLALSSEEAMLLSFVQEHGKIQLILHPAVEEPGIKPEPVEAVGWDTLFQYISRYSTKELDLTKRELTVEIYRGLHKEVRPLLKGE